MKFSQRYGHSPIKSVMQIESIDDDLRNALWTAATICYWNTVQYDGEIINPRRSLSYHSNRAPRELCERLWVDLFKKPIDRLDDGWDTVYDKLRSHFFACEWFEVYDFVEFLAENYPEPQVNREFVQLVNMHMEREVGAFRFVDRKIVRITDEEEIQAIEAAASTPQNAVREHIDRATSLLADRQSPDYRNSIKESISAVEALVRSVTGDEAGTLGKLLNQIETCHPLHPALKSAFSKLYGYTSDAKGIRHAIVEGGGSVTFEEAKFMLVACSAFVNYVRGTLKDGGST